MPSTHPVAVFGLSSEGYQIASTLARKGVPVVIIDENLGVGMELGAEDVANYTTIQELHDGETLLHLKPIEEVLGRAEYVFFTPKIRKAGEEARIEINLRLKEAARHLKEHSTFINTIPVGMGGNYDITGLIERVSGLQMGEGFTYIYSPLHPCSKTPITIGSNRLTLAKGLVEVLKMAEVKPLPPLPLSASELVHAKHVLSHFSNLTTHLELLKKVGGLSDRVVVKKPIGYRDLYLDDLMAYAFDLNMLSNTFSSGEPLLYFATGMLKGMGGYIKYLFDEVKRLMKTHELKASKTRIIAAWSIDQYEIRGERLSARESMVEKFKDYVSDTIAVTTTKDWSATLQLTGRTNIMVACSQRDYEMFSSTLPKEKGVARCFLVKANLLVEWMEW